MNKTRVVFYKENDDVLAVFFNLDHNLQGDKVCYSRVGQHSSCSVDYAMSLKMADESEYKDLKNELESLGYNLKIINKEV